MPKVVIYSTPTCPYCKQEKAFLTEKGITFQDIDVGLNEAKAEEMIKKSGQMGVPVTVITKDGGKEEIIIGFDQKRISKALGI